MKQYAVIVVLASLAMVAAVPPGLAQDASLQLALSLDSPRIWPSQAGGLHFVVEFKNQLNETLRWHPQLSGIDLPCRLCLERADGTTYLATGWTEKLISSNSSQEYTDLLPGGQSWFTGDVVGQVWEADEDKTLPKYVDQIEESGITRAVPSYEGPIPVGEYEVYLAFHEGPPLNDTFPERSPAQGTYTSNRVHLSVVAEGTPLAAAGRLREGGGQILQHRGVGLVRATALGPQRVTSQVRDGQLILARGTRTVSLPCNRVTAKERGKDGPQVPAIAVTHGADYYVPLRYVGERLGLTVAYNPRTREFDVHPAAETKHASRLERKHTGDIAWASRPRA